MERGHAHLIVKQSASCSPEQAPLGSTRRYPRGEHGDVVAHRVIATRPARAGRRWRPAPVLGEVRSSCSIISATVTMRAGSMSLQQSVRVQHQQCHPAQARSKPLRSAGRERRPEACRARRSSSTRPPSACDQPRGVTRRRDRDLYPGLAEPQVSQDRRRETTVEVLLEHRLIDPRKDLCRVPCLLARAQRWCGAGIL